MVVSDFLPSLGFFYCGSKLGLSIEVGCKINGLRLSISDPKYHHLNIKKVDLVYADQVIDLKDLILAVSQSSTTDNPQFNEPTSLFTGNGIHSKYEEAPWWECTFSKPINIDSIRIDNRPDGWGCRSRFLRVEIKTTSLAWVTVYDGRDSQRLYDVLNALNNLGISFDSKNFECPNTLRKSTIEAICKALILGKINICEVDWRSILQLVNLWGNHPDKTLNDSEYTLIAIFLLAMSLRGDTMTFTIFSLILYRRELIKKTQTLVNDISSKLGFGSWVFTRHGIQPARLLVHKNEYLDLLKKICSWLEARSLEPLIAYGTLLGAIRDSAFISHDDDLDILYKISAYNYCEAVDKVNFLAGLLQNDGFTVIRMGSNALNMHIQISGLKASIDIFPFWQVENSAHLYMEKMQLRPIDINILLPRSFVELYDEKFPAPHRPADFLRERYGESWPIPDLYFEWPWALD